MKDRSIRLTEAQRRCLRLVAKGCTSKEIALETALSPHTVSKYLEAATAALGAANRREAAQMFASLEASNGFEQFEYEAAEVANQPKTAIPEASIEGSQPQHSLDEGEAKAWHRLAFWFPPMGGDRHELDSVGAVSAIVRIAVVSGGGCAIIVAIGYWLMRLFA